MEKSDKTPKEEKDRQISLAVGKEISDSLERVSNYWTRQDVKELLFPKVLDLYLPSIHILDLVLERGGPSKMFEGFTRDTETIAFLDQEGILKNIFYVEDPENEEIKESITLYQQEGVAKKILLVDFWNQQVLGEESGEIEISKPQKGWGEKYVVVNGSFLSLLPEEFKEAASVEISSEGMSILWRNLTDDETKIDLRVCFQKRSMKKIMGYDVVSKQHITTEPIFIKVYKNWLSGNPDDDNETSLKEIILDKAEGSFEDKNRKYDVCYKKNKKEVEISIKGDSWQKSIKIPSHIDPLAITKLITGKIDEINQAVIGKKDEVKWKVQEIKQMNLLEDSYYRQYGILIPPILMLNLRPEDYQGTPAASIMYIDRELANLDEKTKYTAKYYMALLRDLKRTQDPRKELETLRQSFRETIKKYDIKIPKRLIKLSEDVFVPK